MKLLVLNVADAYSVLFNSLKFKSQQKNTDVLRAPNPAGIADVGLGVGGPRYETRPGEVERFEIDPDGREIVSRSGRIKVRIARNTWESPVFFELREDRSPIIAEGRPWGYAFDINVFRPDGRQASGDLLRPVQIEYSYDPAEFNGRAEGIRLFYFVEKLQIWLILPGHTDSASRLVVGRSKTI